MLERLTQAASSKLKCQCLLIFSWSQKGECSECKRNTCQTILLWRGPPTLSFASTVAERGPLDIVHGWPWWKFNGFPTEKSPQSQHLQGSSNKVCSYCTSFPVVIFYRAASDARCLLCLEKLRRGSRGVTCGKFWHPWNRPPLGPSSPDSKVASVPDWWSPKRLAQNSHLTKQRTSISIEPSLKHGTFCIL